MIEVHKKSLLKELKRIIRTILSTIIGPIIVGFVLLYLGNRFNKNLENINDQLFIKFSNAPQIWGYDPVEYTTDRIFHDFQFKDELNADPNYSKDCDFAVQYLWADPYSNRKSHNFDKINGGFARISANITEENALRIYFINTGWGTNLTIRNRHSKSTYVRDFSNIVIKFKSPSKDTVGIRVRVVDFDNIHWAYGKYKVDKFGNFLLDTYSNKLIEYFTKDKDNKELMCYSNDVKDVKIDLTKNRWVHYCYDGVKEINSKMYASPFYMINFIILEVGFDGQYSKLSLRHDLTGFYIHSNKEGVIDILKIGFE
jgi:hypothetical protein